MGAGLLTVILTCLILAASVAAAPARQLCLSCHPAHYLDRGRCTACHRGNPASDRKNIAHQNLIAARFARFTLGQTYEVREGVRLVEQYACRRCHLIGGRGNRLSVDLDQAAARRSPEELERSILKPAAFMPDFRMDSARAVLVVNALLGAAADTPGPARPSGPQVVHFDRSDGERRDIFSRKCGGCHRALTSRMGALGRGDAGPNLAGLLTPHYPKTFRSGNPWTERALDEWLKNPRIVRPWSTMQPVPLTAAEFRELLTVLKPETGS